jgi:hypothetical protein
MIFGGIKLRETTQQFHRSCLHPPWLAWQADAAPGYPLHPKVNAAVMGIPPRNRSHDNPELYHFVGSRLKAHNPTANRRNASNGLEIEFRGV